MHSSSQPFALRPPPASQSLVPSHAVASNHAPLLSTLSTRAVAPQLAKPRHAVAATTTSSSITARKVDGVVPAATAAQAGLPLLPSLAANVAVEPARPLQPLAWTISATTNNVGGVVDMFGDVGTRESVRNKLLRFYEDTQQVQRASDNNSSKSTDSDAYVSEMTLRIDTELELLRQQCFAERNAQWHYDTPDMFDYAPTHEPLWMPQLVGNSKIALRRLKADAPAELSERDAIAAAAATGSFAGVAVPDVAGAVSKVDARGVPLGQFSRDRPWPPRAFTQKAAVRAPRGRGGKRKAPIVVLEERSALSKVCAECRTQSTPLWRKLARVGDAYVAVQSEPLPAVAATPPLTSNTTELPAVAAGPTESVPATVSAPALNVCLSCFLKLQRSDLVERKTRERSQQLRERQERIAQRLLLEKKRLKQQQTLAKKQQTLALTQAAKTKKRRSSVVVDTAAAVVEAVDPTGSIGAASSAPVALKLVVKTELVAAVGPVKAEPIVAADLDDTIATTDDMDATAAAVAAELLAAKRERKKSKKDKKSKKKKKRRRVTRCDSDSDTSATALPSPPLLAGHYEYADVKTTERTKASFDLDGTTAAYEREPVQVLQPKSMSNKDDSDGNDASRHEQLEEPAPAPSKRKRKSLSRSESAPALLPEAAATSPSPSSTVSTSRKRRSAVALPLVVDVKTDDNAPELDESEPVRASGRPLRAARTPVAASSAVTTPQAAALSAASSANTRKRTRTSTKKESARERELRALGQYCPVCNAVYEEDDDSTFVCCDSCEMWVHGSCDTTLTPTSIAALAESNDKYICPLCAGR